MADPDPWTDAKMAENDGRGFASPPDELHDRVGGRIRARLLLHASRGWLTVGLVVLTWAALVGLTQLPGVDLPGAMGASDPASTLFQALVGSIITGVTIVVTITQLVLSQELGPLNDQRQRMDGAMDFRERVEDLLGVPAAPPEPSAFLRAIAETIDDHALALRDAAAEQLDHDDLDDRPSWEEVHEYAELVLDVTGEVGEELRGAQFGTFAVVAAALDLNYSWRIYVGRRLARDEDSPLHDDEHGASREHLDALLELLALFAPAREHFKTLYFEWELSNLSRRILVLAGPALVTAMAALLLLDSPAPPAGTTFGIANAIWFVTGAATISITPFVLLASYIVRIITVAKLTLAAGPFILRETNRSHEIEWGA